MGLTTATVAINASANIEQGTNGSLGNSALASRASTNYEAGTADGAADTAYTTSLTVTNPTAATLDLAGGTIVQTTGAIASFAEIGTLILRYVSGTGVLTIGGGSNPLVGVAGTLEKVNDTIVFHKPTSGIAVTAGTGDILTFSSSSGVIVVDVFVLGRSA